MARPTMASFCTGIVAACSIAAAATALSVAGCSSPSRAPESDVIEVERIDLTAPKGAAEEAETLVLPGAAPVATPTETVPAPESK